MPWTDSHLYAFMAGGAEWGVPDPDFDDGPQSAAKTTLFDVLEGERHANGARTIHYIYDFGDSWDHTIRIERVGEADPGDLPSTDRRREALSARRCRRRARLRRVPRRHRRSRT